MATYNKRNMGYIRPPRPNLNNEPKFKIGKPVIVRTNNDEPKFKLTTSLITRILWWGLIITMLIYLIKF